MFDFNQYSSLLLVGFVQGVVFTALLLWRGWREDRISDFFAAGILVVGTLYVAQWMLGFAGWYDAHDWRTTLMFYMKWEHLVLLGPLIWFYFRSVTNTDFRWKRKYWLHFLPWAIYLSVPVGIFVYDWVYWRLLSGQAFTSFYGTRGPASEWDNEGWGVSFIVLNVAIRIQILIYLVLTVRYYHRYLDYLRGEFSNAGRLRLPGLGTLLYLLLAGIALAFFFEAGNLIFGAENYMESWNRYFVMSVLVFFSAIQFHRIDTQLTRTLRFEPDPPTRRPAYAVAETEVETSPDTHEDEELERWSRRLLDRLEQHADHLDPELKLGDLAGKIGTNASVLSRVINTVHGMNFNDFINARRCSEFLKRIEAGEHERHTLLSLALDCGFNSKSTFNRAFRKQYGYSPGEAIRRKS